MNPTAKEKILKHIQLVGMPLAVHEFPADMGVSQNSIAARLRELTQDGKLRRGYREGSAFKEWFLPSK